MSASAANAPTPTDPGELAALHSAISEAIEAMIAWDIAAFQSAANRQRELCNRLALYSEWRQLPGTTATARRVRDLNRVYSQLLNHSIRWTRILQSILQPNGHAGHDASVHFRA